MIICHTPPVSGCWSTQQQHPCAAVLQFKLSSGLGPAACLGWAGRESLSQFHNYILRDGSQLKIQPGVVCLWARLSSGRQRSSFFTYWVTEKQAMLFQSRRDFKSDDHLWRCESLISVCKQKNVFHSFWVQCFLKPSLDAHTKDVECFYP